MQYIKPNINKHCLPTYSNVSLVFSSVNRLCSDQQTVTQAATIKQQKATTITIDLPIFGLMLFF